MRRRASTDSPRSAASAIAIARTRVRAIGATSSFPARHLPPVRRLRVRRRPQPRLAAWRYGRPEANPQRRGNDSSPGFSGLLASSGSLVAPLQRRREERKKPYQTPSTPRTNHPSKRGRSNSFSCIFGTIIRFSSAVAVNHFSMDFPCQNRFSGPVTVSRERRLPVAATPAGYAALIGAYALRVPLPRLLSATGDRHRNIHEAGWRIYSPRYAPKPSLEGHLTFALKHEELNLAVLKRLFEATGPAPPVGEPGPSRPARTPDASGSSTSG